MWQATPDYGFFIPRRVVKARLRAPGRCQAGPSSDQLALEHRQFSEDPESRPLAGIVARTLPPTSGAVPTRIRIRSGQIVRQNSMRRRLCPRRPDFHVAGVPPDCRGTGSKGALRACLPEQRIPSATRWAFPSPAGVGHMDGGDPARVRAILEGPRTGDVPALGARLASRPSEPACSRWRPFRSARPLACRNPKLRLPEFAQFSMNPTLESVRVADSQERHPTHGAALIFQN